MRTPTEDDLRNLILAVDCADRDNQPLAENQRRKLISELEASLSCGKRLKTYVYLVRTLLRIARHQDRTATFEERDAHAVLIHGLSGLTDKQLVYLAFSPAALERLSDYIFDNPELWDNGPWGELISDMAVTDMRRRGLDPEAVIAKAKTERLTVSK